MIPDFKEWDGRSDRLRNLRPSDRKVGAMSDVLLEPGTSEGGALSDWMPEQQRLAMNIATFDGQLRSRQKRHEEELEAIRERYRRHELADVENLLVAKIREQEDEIARLQQEFSDLLRSREEELEQVIETLQQEADSKSKQLKEINHDYDSLMSVHREIEEHFKDSFKGRDAKQAEASGNSGKEYVFPQSKSLKETIVRCVKDPVYISLMVHF